MGQNQREMDKAVSTWHNTASTQATGNLYVIGVGKLSHAMVAAEQDHIAWVGIDPQDSSVGFRHGLEQKLICGKAQGWGNLLLTEEA